MHTRANEANLKFLIAGTGRCGTGYMAALFNELGIPCGHEKVFNADDKVKGGPWVGDSSWHCVPFLPVIDLPVLHVVRHPLDVIGSLLNATRLFEPNAHGKHQRYLEKHFELRGGYDADFVARENAARYWYQWNTRIRTYASARVNIDHRSTLGNVANFLNCVGFNFTYSDVMSAREKLPCRTNASATPYERVDRGQIPLTMIRCLKNEAAYYGYEV